MTDFHEFDWIQIAFVPLVLMLALIPLPALGFAQFKSLARRAGSEHLMEHCSIVGVGVAGTLVVVYVAYLLFTFAEDWGLGTTWTTRSPVSLVLMLTTMAAVVLFWFWCVYLMIRFAISFGRASRESRRAWKAADHSISTD